MQALEKQLEAIDSAFVQEDEDMEDLKKIQAILENTHFGLKDLKWMASLFYSFSSCRPTSFVVIFFCEPSHLYIYIYITEALEVPTISMLSLFFLKEFFLFYLFKFNFFKRITQLYSIYISPDSPPREELPLSLNL